MSPDETSPDERASAERSLDKIDVRILRVLQKDGRISNLKLAETVHLSPTAVLERVKRLTRDGYILGYEARLNPSKLGAGLLVFVEILLDRTVHDVMDNFKAAVQVRPEILECHLVAGGFDYLLKTRVANMTAYRERPRLRGRDAALARRAAHVDLQAQLQVRQHRRPLFRQTLRGAQPVDRVHPVEALGDDPRLVALKRADQVPFARGAQVGQGV